MSFEEWPDEMVQPGARDFMHGLWECGSRGCASGWVNTAFGEPVTLGYAGLVGIPPGTPAAEFAEALADALGPAARKRFDEHQTQTWCPERVSYGLSAAFEHTSVTGPRMEKAWVVASRRKGFVVPAGRFR